MSVIWKEEEEEEEVGKLKHLFENVDLIGGNVGSVLLTVLSEALYSQGRVDTGGCTAIK